MVSKLLYFYSLHYLVKYNGFLCFQSVVEKVVYKISDENPEKTIAIRSAWIDSQVLGFARAIRSFGCERFKKNCIKTVGIYLFSKLFLLPGHQLKHICICFHLQIAGFDYVLSSMFPTAAGNAALNGAHHAEHNYVTAASKLKEVAKKRSEQVKAQAEQIYQSYSVKN